MARERDEEVVVNENGERVIYRDREKKKRNPFLFGCLGLLLLVLIIGACAAMFGGTEEESTEVVEEEETDAPAKEKKYKIGDEVTLENVKFKPTSATFTDERNEFADTEADKVLVIDMDITNNGKEDIPVGTDVSAYADGKKLEPYPINDSLMDALSPNRSISGKQGFAVVGNPKKFELEFEPFLSGKKAIYEIDPK